MKKLVRDGWMTERDCPDCQRTEISTRVTGPYGFPEWHRMYLGSRMMRREILRDEPYEHDFI